MSPLNINLNTTMGESIPLPEKREGLPEGQVLSSLRLENHSNMSLLVVCFNWQDEEEENNKDFFIPEYLFKFPDNLNSHRE